MSGQRSFDLAPPMFEHLAEHLRARKNGHGWALGEELVPLMALMLGTGTIREVSEGLGPGWTWRLVDYRWSLIRDTLHIPQSPQHLERVALLRLAVGLDPCFVCDG
ncbi:MAG TPA: hypothetical protein DCQ64_14090 [Candidatus Rokubacteria bacterium]|nr:hypothetical protein [Candidatus Rokubacteria bacterium]